ncbi:hypothetical protein SpiGrapes_1612 [Sphaerochaeta pleomorpha str. Grapes]|uniref:Uncharacterized protein n=1 Tax=Sphaerochaeta pleomorpha (strain ATCC BAA-1885 / DSM 22778 / Grapes) TaxID=158190 RepID=G8QWC1_SPHPG|nr:hypothetical protein [Sphaerochaeta pleomorpha]AEV29419.1 hypothetical protein SpiGrapes_1612 [Sphaerochaeta pleomorpha str. Grapes]
MENFSNHFGIPEKILREYGAVDIPLTSDLPLFIDPMLLYSSHKPEYEALHDKIIQRFEYLVILAEMGSVYENVKRIFNFQEIPYNWLGFSREGNKGKGVKDTFGRQLLNNLKKALENNGVSDSSHIEKLFLMDDKSGQDRISDLCVNIIQDYLYSYTESFAKNSIDPAKLKEFTVVKADLNCETGEFISKTYTLPFIMYKGKPERVILTPLDMVRETRMAINRRDFVNNYSKILATIDNDALRVYVNSMLEEAVKRFLEKRTAKKKPTERTLEKIRMNEFSSLAYSSKPILYDYYIRMQENNGTEILQQGMSEFQKADELYLQNAGKLTSGLQAIEGLCGKTGYARSSGISFLKSLKGLIERDGYKDCLEKGGEPIQKQSEINQFFNMVFWNVFGRSLFAKIEPEIEIKKAKLFEGSHYLKNNGANSLIALLCLQPEDEKSVLATIESKGLNGKIGDSIFLITCY